MRLEIDIPEHHYNNIMSIDSISLGRAPYKGIIMYAINAIKQGKILEQEPTTKNDLVVDCISRDSAIKALDYDIKFAEFKPGISEYMDDIAKLLDTIYEIQVNNLKELPPVTPQLSSELEKNSKKLEKDIGESDCISRQAVLEQAYAYGNGLEPDGYCVNVEDIQALPPVIPQPRWIPVSERLPEDHKDVLAYLSSDRISICRYNSHKLPVSNNPIGWGYLHGIGFIDFEKEHVMAWMPLPTNYSEVEE